MTCALRRGFPEIVKSLAFLDGDPAKHLATQDSRANPDVPSGKVITPEPFGLLVQVLAAPFAEDDCGTVDGVFSKWVRWAKNTFCAQHRSETSTDSGGDTHSLRRKRLGKKVLGTM